MLLSNQPTPRLPIRTNQPTPRLPTRTNQPAHPPAPAGPHPRPDPLTQPSHAPDRPPAYPIHTLFLKRAAHGSPAAAALRLGEAVAAAPELRHRRGSSVREVEVLVRRWQPGGLGAAAGASSDGSPRASPRASHACALRERRTEVASRSGLQRAAGASRVGVRELLASENIRGSASGSGGNPSDF